ncbi:hypothetical protein B0J18DRAFT_410601 [Chaetomium sp. MPI-SDFR-AT-0129]|nr:hypothetical protein B0J18DRAFT_410601 [Chaetomium sp. MPI-SDFR-AT-0129]
MRATTIATLATLLATTTASPNPNGWSTTKTAPDSPTKLDDCGCGPIYKTMVKCQTLPMTPDGKAIHECVCVPNPDGWYGYLDSCRDCLSQGAGSDFFNNYAMMITQLLVSCTQAGGNVWSTGDSICATNAYTEDCVSLGTDGRASWASIDSTRSDSGNATYVLDIKGSGSGSSTKSSSAGEPKTSSASKGAASSSSSVSSGAASKTTGAVTTGTATGAATTGTGSATQGTQGTQTTTGPASATTSPSAGSRVQAGIVGLVLALGAVVLM